MNELAVIFADKTKKYQELSKELTALTNECNDLRAEIEQKSILLSEAVSHSLPFKVFAVSLSECVLVRTLGTLVFVELLPLEKAYEPK